MKAFSRFFFFSFILLLNFSCGKQDPGLTSSRIKIVGSNAFSTGSTLASSANNGLLLYGKSADGKSFLKKIDSNTVDMNFPNGTWNFYAVAWELAGAPADSKFHGYVRCAKSIGVQLKGIDVQVNLNLSNNNCTTEFHPEISYEGSKYVFPKLSIFSCKKIGGQSSFAANSSTSCDQAIFNNKGYATSFKIVVPEYNSMVAATGVATESRCLTVSSGTGTADLSTESSAYAEGMGLPLSGLNGFEAYVKVFYSATPCDDSNGFTKISLSNNPGNFKAKRFNFLSAGAQSISQYFLETDEGPICQGPRLNPITFASGAGTSDLPYTICTPEQFKLLESNYSNGFTTKNKNFDLINDLDFAFTNLAPIGDGVNGYVGAFNGRNHRISNFKIDCASLGTANNVGLFRSTATAKFSNLILNRAVIDCKRGTIVNNSVGALVGFAGGQSSFDNIKVFAHVSGDSTVGGVLGSANENSFMKNVHFEGGVNGENYVGGLVGYIAGSSPINFIANSSFKGEISAICLDGSSFCDSKAGGLVGSASWTSLGGAIRESLAKVSRLEGISVLGGLVGAASKIEIYDSIATGFISSKISSSSTNKIRVGSLVGIAENGVFSRNITSVVKYLPNKPATDTSSGSIVGVVGTTAPTCSGTPDNNYGLASLLDSNNSFACNSNSTITDLQNLGSTSTYNSYFLSYPMATTSAFIFPTDEAYSAGAVGYKGIPRLKWELPQEPEVPYLKNECAGSYGAQSATGSSPLDPLKICTVLQFKNMIPGRYYALKKDLNFEGENLNVKPAGIYYLDGNGYSLINFNVNVIASSNIGLFSELFAGSEIKNLKLIFGTMNSSGMTLTGSYAFGLLAGVNSGRIEGVSIIDSNLIFTKTSFFSAGDQIFSAGGIVGKNSSTGKILNSDINSSVYLKYPRIETDTVYMGSIAGSNAGVIQGIRSRGSVERSMGDIKSSNATVALGATCSGLEGKYLFSLTNYYYCDPLNPLWQLTYPVSSREHIAGLVGINAGNISEVKYDGNLTIKDDGQAASESGVISPIVAYNLTGASLSDLEITGKFVFVEYYRGMDQVVSQNDGLLTRILFRPSAIDYFTFTNQNIFDGQPDNICINRLASYCFASTSVFNPSLNPLILESDVGASLYSSYFDFWSVTNNFGMKNNYVWFNDNFDKNISLIKPGGSFEKIGKGF